MLFETEKKAQLFIKFNGDSITDDVSKLRTYYCPACCGYHISSKPVNPKGYHNTERMIKNYHKDTDKKANDILNDPNNELYKKCSPYIEKVHNEYYNGKNQQLYTLEQYIKFTYSNELTGNERDYLCRKIRLMHNFLKLGCRKK